MRRACGEGEEAMRKTPNGSGGVDAIEASEVTISPVKVVMKYQVVAREWTTALTTRFGEQGSVHELSDAEVVDTLLAHGRAGLTDPMRAGCSTDYVPPLFPPPLYDEGGHPADHRILYFNNDYD